MADLLLSEGADANCMNNLDQGTPLHRSTCHPKITALLLQQGANVNAVTKNGETALFLAAEFGETETMSLLLNAGAMLELANTSGETPFSVAARTGHAEATELLIKRGANTNSN